MRHKLINLIATFFYIGNIPRAPGSAASIAGVFICWMFSQNLLIYVVVFLSVTLLGFLVVGEKEKMMGQKDPSVIVIDEVAGVMIAFFLLPWTPAVLWTTFFLFRAFDMFKIYPVYKFEKFSGSAGVMLDDIVAGVYTNITMHAALKLSSTLKIGG